jgi:predicted lipoprotein with Yx(FWY)xxD motif
MKSSRPLSTALIIAVVGIVVLAFAVTSGSARKTSTAAANALSVKQTSLGKILVGANGRTLYLFLGDKHNASRLSAAGLVVWPAFTTRTTPQAQGGAIASHIATIAAAGGKRQVTYSGHPLYYFVGDRQAGSTTGQGLFEFGAKWYVLAPSGNAITAAAPAAPAPAVAEPSGGYHY